jgi:hypothetical protein
MIDQNDSPHRFWKSPAGQWYVVGPGPEVRPGGEVLVEMRSGSQDYRIVRAVVGYVYVVVDSDEKGRK